MMRQMEMEMEMEEREGDFRVSMCRCVVESGMVVANGTPKRLRAVVDADRDCRLGEILGFVSIVSVSVLLLGRGVCL